MPQYSTIPPRSPDITSLRVLTFNIYGVQANPEQRAGVIEPGIRELDPDLISLHETLLTDERDQAAELVGAGYHLIHSRDRGPDGIGWTTASRWPVSWSEEVDLNVTPRTADFPCTAIIAGIEAPPPFAPLLFVNHIPSWQLHFEAERLLQAVAVARRIEEFVAGREMHVVLAGDLDADLDSASVRFLTGRQPVDTLSVCYRDAWESVHGREPGESFSQRNALMTEANWDWPFRQIDHVMVRCALHGGPTLKIAGCELAFGEPVDGVWASDHIGVVADLEHPGVQVEFV